MSPTPLELSSPLGRRIASYDGLRSSRAQVTGWLTVSGSMALLGLMSIDVTWTFAVLCLIATSSLTVGLVLLFNRLWPRQVHLHQRGLEVVRGKHSSNVRWSHLREVYQVRSDRLNGWLGRRSKHKVPSLLLVTGDSRRVRLSNLEGIRGLASRIDTEVNRRMLPFVVESYESGSTIRFGRRLAISKRGLQIGTLHLAWNDIVEVTINPDDSLAVVRADQPRLRLKVPLRQIPNLAVLTSLLDRITTAEEDPVARPPDSAASVSEDPGSLILMNQSNESQVDVSDLLLEGFDWDDIYRLLHGECALDELLEKGPRYRPRQPR